MRHTRRGCQWLHHELILVGLTGGLYDIGYGTVLDSGTTFTYLPSAAFEQLQTQVRDFALAKGLHTIPGPDPSFSDVCFGDAPSFDHPDEMKAVFPSLELHFEVTRLSRDEPCLQCHHVSVTHARTRAHAHAHVHLRAFPMSQTI